MAEQPVDVFVQADGQDLIAGRSGRTHRGRGSPRRLPTVPIISRTGSPTVGPRAAARERPDSDADRTGAVRRADRLRA